MAARDDDSRGSAPDQERSDYPLKETTALLNERLGLYLSAEQQRGFATGLLIGTVLGAALLAWNIGELIRRKI